MESDSQNLRKYFVSSCSFSQGTKQETVNLTNWLNTFYDMGYDLFDIEFFESQVICIFILREAKILK